MLLLALVFLPQLWSLSCTDNSAINHCASMLLVDDASQVSCDPCNTAQCCIVDPIGEWQLGFYSEAYTQRNISLDRLQSCVESVEFVPFKTRIQELIFSPSRLTRQSDTVAGEFRGYIGWQTPNFDNDFVSVTCPGPDLEFEWQLGSKVDVPNSSFIRVPYILKYKGPTENTLECIISVNGVPADANKDAPVRLWTLTRDAWVNSSSATQLREVGEALTEHFCNAGASRCAILQQINFMTGDPFTVCALDIVQCLALGDSPLVMEDVVWAFHPYGQVATNKRAVDLIMGRVTHVALMLQDEPLNQAQANFSLFSSALAMIAVYNMEYTTPKISLVAPTTLQAFVGTASNISIDASSGNLTQLSYFSGPFDENSVLVEMPMVITAQLFPSGWSIADTWIRRDAPLHRNVLCSYLATQAGKLPRTSGLVSTTCNINNLPNSSFYCLQGLWDNLETMVISGIPGNLAYSLVRAPKLRTLVLDYGMTNEITLRVDPTEVLQISNNPRLSSVTFKGTTHRAPLVSVFGNTILGNFNVNNSVQTLDLSFSNTTLVSSFDSKSFPILSSFTCVTCYLSALPPTIEKRMPQLKYLNLSTNRIQFQLNKFVESLQWGQMRARLCRLNLDFNMIGGPFPANYSKLLLGGCAVGEESQLDFAYNLIESFQSAGEVFIDGSDAKNWTSQFVLFPEEFSRALCMNSSTLPPTTNKIPWLVLRGNRLKGPYTCGSSLLDISFNNVWMLGDTTGCMLLSAWTSYSGRNSTERMFPPFALSWREASTLYMKFSCESQFPPGEYGISGFVTVNSETGDPVRPDSEDTYLLEYPLSFSTPNKSAGLNLYDDYGNVWAQRQEGYLGNYFYPIWTTQSCSLGKGDINGVCELCPLNTWSEWCGNCIEPTMYLPDGFRHKSCSKCPSNIDGLGTTISKTIYTVTKYDAAVNLDECVCPFATYGFPAQFQGLTPTSTCRDCRDFAVCTKVNETRPAPRDGYYYNWSSNLFMTCDPSKACKAGHCEIGYVPTPGGSPCSKCDSNFYRVNRECRECFSAAPFLLGLLGVFLLFALFYLLRISKTDSTKLFTLSISLGYMQIISIFAAFPVSWPKTTTDMLNFLSFFNFNFDLASPECAVQTNFWNKWLMKLLLPLIAGGVMGIWYLLLRCSPKLQEKWIRFVTRKPGLDRCMMRFMVGSSARKLVHQRQMSSRESNAPDEQVLAMEWEKEHLKNRFVCATMTLATLGYTFVAKTSTQPFNCLQTIYETHPHLRADPSISCYDTTWYSWLPLAVFFNLLYTAGIPLTFLGILIRAYRKKKLQDPDFLSNFGNLVLPFREQYWFWELIQLSRKLITVLLIDFKADSTDTTTFGQINGVLLVLVLFFILQQFIRPYEFTWCNRLEFAWTGMTLLILMAALIFSFNILNANQLNAYSVFLILSLCVVLAITLYTLFLEKRRVLVRVGLGNNAFHKIETDHQLLNEVFGDDLGDNIYRQTRGMSPELREQFFAKVSGLTPMSIPQSPSTVGDMELSTKLLKKEDGSSGGKGNPAVFPNLL